MHELAIAESLLEIVNDTVKRHHLIKVNKIRLKIGLLTSVVPEALEFSWQALTKNTVCEGSSLEMKMIPVRGRCRGCGKEVFYKDADQFCFLCPDCGQEIEILEGRDLSIEEIEGEEEDENSSS